MSYELIKVTSEAKISQDAAAADHAALAGDNEELRRRLAALERAERDAADAHAARELHVAVRVAVCICVRLLPPIHCLLRFCF